MSYEMLSDLIFACGLIGVFFLSVVIITGLLYLAYMFIPCYREWCDKFDEGLPEWEEVE